MGKPISLTLMLLLLFKGLFAQTPQTSIIVGGEYDKFYPVVWQDANWEGHKPTILEIGRSDVHENSVWRGSLIAQFRFHTFRWGNMSDFVNAEIFISENWNVEKKDMIAGWRDATISNSSLVFVVWLRGGGTTYHYSSPNASIPAPIVYDGTDGRIAYQEQNGPLHTFKTEVDSYVNTNGTTYGGDFRVNGRIGIGANPASSDAVLSVKGKVVASEVKVTEVGSIPDYVFDPSYKLMNLKEVEAFTKENRHLPGIPSEAELKKEGMDLVAMNVKLLQKVEELTLYLIEKEKRITDLEERVKRQDLLEAQIDKLNAAILILTKKSSIK